MIRTPRRLDALVDAHVDDALRPFLTEPDKRAFVPADLEGAVVYQRVGRVAISIGDPIGPDGWAAFDRFRVASRRRGVTTAVYQATDAGRAGLIARGYRVVPVGREALVDLAAFSLSGSGRANLRHTVTRARRGSVTVHWHPAGLSESTNGLATALEGLDGVWAERAGPSMGFTVTRFRPELLGGTPLAVAFDADHRPIALATFRQSGPDSHVLDLIRRRPGSTPGALEACIAEAAAALAAAGVRRLSLGLAPLSGLDPDSPLPEERWLAAATGAVRGAYDVDGLAFFKGKFDPAWQTRYLAFETRRDFPAVAGGLLWLHLAQPGEPPPAVAAGIAGGLARQTRAAWRTRRDPAAVASDTAAEAPVTGTSAMTRLTVMALGAAGVWAGRQFGARAGARAFAALGATAAGVAATTAVGSRRSRHRLAAGGRCPDGGSGALPRITVLVPARNEERVLPALIRDLAAQDHRDDAGRPRFNVIVIDDRSSDQTLHRTLEAARKAAVADIVEVRPRRGRRLADGKGAALASVPLAACAEVVVVLDADARLAPSTLRVVAAVIAEGNPAVAIRRRVSDADRSWLAQAQADEQAIDAAFEEARWAFGGTAEFRGNGIAIRRDLLADAGGWRNVLTEDLDLAARLAVATSARIAWPTEPLISELPVLGGRDLWRQRVRWAEGAIRANLAWTLPLLRSRHASPAVRTERTLYAAQLLLPFVAFGALVGGARRGRRGAAAAVAIPTACLAGVTAIAIDALPRAPTGQRLPFAARVRRAVGAAAFMSLWMAAVPRAAARVAFGRGPLRYDQTPHVPDPPR